MERHPELDPPRKGIDPESMSMKQLLMSVYHGRRIRFEIFDGEPIEGYLAGIDHEYFKVVIPDGDKITVKLVYRPCNPTMDLRSESTYTNEPLHDTMEEIIAPFRAAMRRLSGRTAPGGS
jgi:translation initiation factor IF-1